MTAIKKWERYMDDPNTTVRIRETSCVDGEPYSVEVIGARGFSLGFFQSKEAAERFIQNNSLRQSK